MNFKTQINNRLGDDAYAGDSATTQFLNNSIIDVINKVKAVNPDAYSRMAVKTEVSSSGTTLIDGDIIAVYGSPQMNTGGSVAYRRPAVEIPFELSEVAKDSSSIHYQSPYSPAWFREGRSIAIIPDGGMVLHVNIPTTSYDAEDIHSMPKQFTRSVVLGATIQNLEWYMTKFARDDKPVYDPPAWPSDPSFTLSIPSGLTAPSFAWTDVSLQDEFLGTTIDASLVRSSFPVYVAPVLEAVATLSIGDLDLPDPPAVPANLQLALDFTESPPAYQQQAMEIVPFPSDVSTLDISTISIPDVPSMPSLVAEIYAENNVDALPAPPVYTPPKLLGAVEQLMENVPDSTSTGAVAALADITNLSDMLSASWNFIAKEEDVELASAVNSFVGQVVSIYSQAVANAQQEYQAQSTEYQATIARQMDEIRLAQADDIKQKDANWTAATTQYSQELAQHSADMSRYNAEIQTATSEWTSNNITYKVAKWNSLQGHKFTEFNNRVTDAMNKFNSDGAAYEKKWQEAVKKVDISGLNLSNELAIFDKQMSEYNGAVSSLTQEHQQNEILKKWEVYKFDSQQAISNFNAEVSSNMNTFNEQNTVLSTELTIAQANASNEQAALSAKMSASTELAKNNEAQRLAQELQTWQQELATFTNELNRYSTEASTEISKFNTLLSSASNRMTDSMNKFNTSLQTFQSEQQSWEKLIGMLKQEYAESIGVMIQNKGE